MSWDSTDDAMERGAKAAERGDEPRTGNVMSDDFAATPERLRKLVKGISREGGKTPPIRLICKDGHESGHWIKVSYRNGQIHMDLRPVGLDAINPDGPIGNGVQDTSRGWSLFCTVCHRRSGVHAPDWVADNALAAVERWAENGRRGRINLKWT